jgi:hypothetical protein
MENLNFLTEVLNPVILLIFRYQVWCNVGPADRSMWYHVSSGDPELLLSTIYVPVSTKHDHRHCMSLDLSAYVR